MSELILNDVKKTFGSTQVLKGLNLDIKEKEFIVLLGPSGCGKSTLLRILAGLETLSSGDISFKNSNFNNLPAKSRNVAMVFQNYALYPHMSVRQNLSLGLKINKTPKDEIEARITEVAQILGLDALLNRKPAQLSGGQRQRVAMGRAMVRNPDIFLFDEPLSNLDAALRVKMRTEIKKLHLRLAKTMIYVTHDQVEAMTLADRIVILNKGNIQQVGTPMDVFEKPANTFVARFIGAPQMNLMAYPNQSIKLNPEFKDIAQNGKEVGFRAQHINRLTSESERLAVEFTAKVVVVEPLGTEKDVILQVEGGDTITWRCDSAEEVLLNAEYRFGVSVERLHFYDESGERCTNEL